MDNDFKRPLGPTTTGTTRPVSSVLPEPGYKQDVGVSDQSGATPNTNSPKKTSSVGKVLLRIVTILLVLGLAGATGWYWLQNDNARKDLASAESSLASAVTDKTVAETKLASAIAKDTPLQTNEVTGETAAKMAATRYACILASFGCDKLVTTTTKFKAVKAPEAGFAVIEVKNATVSTNVFVKSKDDMTWTVIYESRLKPSADIVTKFAIPQDFVLGE